MLLMKACLISKDNNVHMSVECVLCTIVKDILFTHFHLAATCNNPLSKNFMDSLWTIIIKGPM